MSCAAGRRPVTTGRAAHGRSGIVAMIGVRVDTRIHFVHEIRAMGTGIGGAMGGAAGASAGASASAIASVRTANGGPLVTAVIRIN